MTAHDYAMIHDSRLALERAFQRLERIGRWSRLQYGQLYPRWEVLWRRQGEIERLAGLDGPPQMGAIVLPIVIGGMALLGIGGWAWKQHRETAGYEKYLECLEKMEAAGMSPEEAAMVCRGQGQSTAEGLTKLMNSAMLLSLVVGGIWIFTKVWK